MKRILVVAALIAACGGPARTVIVNGREVSYDDAANDLLRRGKQAQDAGRNDEALKIYRDVIARFGGPLGPTHRDGRVGRIRPKQPAGQSLPFVTAVADKADLEPAVRRIGVGGKAQIGA